jgi:large repetitive protein
VTITPASVTIGGADKDPADIEAVTVTNHYDVGSLRLRKFVTEEAEPYPISQGPFTLHVTCTLTDPSRPLGAVVYDDDVVLQGPQPLAAEIDDLPTGAVCTVTEPDPGAANEHTIVPSSVTIGDDTTVRVVVSNLFAAGSLTITKAIVGAGAAHYGAGPFEVSVTCTYTNVDGVEVPLDTPGGTTRELSAANGYTATYLPLLLGSTCHVAETRTGGATDTVITDADGNEVSEVTIQGLTEELTLGITNTFDVGSVRVHKVVKGDGTGPFTVRLACTYDVDGTQTAVDVPGGAERRLSDDNDLTTVYDELPTGAACTLKETDDGGADATTITPNAGDASVGAVTVGDGTTVSLRVVNRFDPGAHGQGPSADTSGPGLPDTGASRWTTYALIGGALALVLGAALVLIAVRRRSTQR